MNKIIRRVFKDNFMISLPTLIISVCLILFLIIGLSTKESTNVSYSATLLEEQIIIEEYLSDSSIIYSIEEPYIIVNPYKISPLTALVIFTTDLEVSIEVTVHGKTTEADIVYVTETTTQHLIPIYGLYADYFNTVTFKIVGSNEDAKVIIIETKVLPSSIELPSRITTTYEYFGNDLMIFNHPSGGPVGYDYLGDVRWYLTEKVFYSINILENGLLLVGSERSLFEGISRTSLYEMDYLGKIYTEYIIPNGYTGQVIELPNNNLLVSSNSIDGGVNNSLIELDRNYGNIINTFDISDTFPTSDGKNDLWSSNNYFDISGLAYDAITNSIYISGKNQDVIINVDYEDFTLNYVIGDPSNFDSRLVELYFLTPLNTPFTWAYYQSDIELLDNGDILVF
ncbi:MAG: aryl-sulfate sulfotransferase, partial [Candidatus Izemoplasma sp.]